jgi:hypothetical protein
MPNIRIDDHEGPEMADEAQWDSRELGADEKYVRATADQTEASRLNESLGLRPVTMRLQKTLVEELERLAKTKGLKYQTYIRMILTNHVASMKHSV